MQESRVSEPSSEDLSLAIQEPAAALARARPERKKKTRATVALSNLCHRRARLRAFGDPHWTPTYHFWKNDGAAQLHCPSSSGGRTFWRILHTKVRLPASVARCTTGGGTHPRNVRYLFRLLPAGYAQSSFDTEIIACASNRPICRRAF